MMFGKGSILSAALVFLLSSGVLSAWLWTDALSEKPTPISCADNPLDLGWAGLSLIALLLVLMVTAAAWILGGAFSTPKYQDFLKGKLWSFLEGAVILCIFTASMIGLQQYGEANIQTARAYAVVIRNTMMTNFAMVLGANTLVSFFTNVNPQFKPFGMKLGLYITFQVAPMFRPVFDTLGMLMQLMTTAILEWFAHDFMLCFVKNNMLPILMPAGIFLRALGLKGGGNALIGIALAFYFVYPFMLVQAGQIITKHVQNEIVPSGQAPEHAWGSNCVNSLGGIDRPICCIGDASMVDPNNQNELYILNGPPDPSGGGNRLSVNKLVNGPIRISLTGHDAGVTAGATCIYNTIIGRAYTGLLDSTENLDIWSMAKGVGAASATFFIMKILNVSFLSFVLAMPAVAFAQVAVYETVYFLFVVSIILPIFNIFITITLAKEITKVLGTEIDLSSLEKLI